MIEITTYDPNTGQILANLTLGNPDYFDMNLPNGALALDGHFPADQYFIDASGEPQILPSPSPSFRHYYDRNRGWVDPRNAEDLENDLRSARQQARNRIITISKSFEDQFITPLPAQTMKYERKETDARSYVAAYNAAVAAGEPEPDSSLYPWVHAEIGITGETAYQVAMVYLNLAYQWQALATAYEPIRLTFTERLNEATSETDLETILMEYTNAINNIVKQ